LIDIKTIDIIFPGGYIPSMAWNVEYTDEFEAWWVGLNEGEQIDIDAVVGLLEEKGPNLPYPYSSDVKGAKYGAIRELRIQHDGKHIESFMPSIPADQPFCLLAVRRLAESAGTNNTYHWLKEFIRNI
jgi:hypothetical protein